jgi:ElaB/YqjD/DUF883 family membrane-anchored ribosome-binding protein
LKQKNDTPASKDSTRDVNRDTRGRLESLRDRVGQGVEQVKDIARNAAPAAEHVVRKIEQPARKAVAVSAATISVWTGAGLDISRPGQPTRNDNGAATEKFNQARHGTSRTSSELRAPAPDTVTPAAAPKDRGWEDIGNDAVKEIGKVTGEIAGNKGERRKFDEEGQSARDATRAAKERGEQYPN